MADTTTTQPGTGNSTEFEAVADQLLADMRQLELLMETDRVEIDRLKVETRALREESARLESETRATLTRLKGVFA